MSVFCCFAPIKKTRKDHTCFLCCRKIPAGSAMFNWSGVFDGSFFYSKICITCHDLTYYVDSSDGFSENDMNEWANKYEVSSPEELLQKLMHLEGKP